MDRALKARLIGAGVLVALAVIVIPELLSGRKTGTTAEEGTPAGRPLRTYTIELGSPASGGTSTATKESTPAVSAPVDHPSAATQTMPAVPAAASSASTPDAAPPPAATATRPQPVPANTAPASAPKAAPPKAASPGSAAAQPAAHGGWAVQVGAFGTPAAADKVVGQLRASGFHAFASPVSRQGKTLYRVRVGPEDDKARAEGLAASLKGRGWPATLVQNE
jgi:DedD protein